MGNQRLGIGGSLGENGERVIVRLASAVSE
jgi:hypothetical protein